MYSSAMKYLSLACVLALLAAPRMLAAPYGMNGASDANNQDDQDQQQKPPEEIPDFSGLNEYIYQPKTTLNFGFRSISGVKSSFSGSGIVPIPTLDTDSAMTSNTPELPLSDPTVPVTGANVNYHDGVVGSDTRTIQNDNGNGSATAILASPDGKTNSWAYADPKQYVQGLMQFHVYSATMPDITGFKAQGGRSSGMEISAARDMRDLNKHLSWKLFSGLSLNDIQSATFGTVRANVTTLTDTYDLFGATPMPAGVSSPAVQTVNVTDSNGNQVLDPSTGAPVTQSVETTVLLGNQPLLRTVTTAADTTSVVDHFKVHGGYVTFRAGPELVYSFSDHLKLSLSVGPALIYAGSQYNVTQVLTPPTGDPIINNLSSIAEKLVPAAYADLTLQYDVSDRTGFYVGGVYQDGGSYVQHIDNKLLGSYQTKIDFANQNGLRTGLDFKF